MRCLPTPWPRRCRGLPDLGRKCRRGRQSFPIIVIQEAGLDGFWIDRVLRKEEIESHIVDPASITTARRHRRAKTDQARRRGTGSRAARPQTRRTACLHDGAGARTPRRKIAAVCASTASTGCCSPTYSADPGEQQAFHDAIRSALTDDQGRCAAEFRRSPGWPGSG